MATKAPIVSERLGEVLNPKDPLAWRRGTGSRNTLRLRLHPLESRRRGIPKIFESTLLQ